MQVLFGELVGDIHLSEAPYASRLAYQFALQVQEIILGVAVVLVAHQHRLVVIEETVEGRLLERTVEDYRQALRLGVSGAAGY